MQDDDSSKRIYHRLPASVKEQFESLARKDAASIGELPGWVFRRLIFHYNKAANAGLSISAICDWIDFAIQSHEEGSCCSKIKEKLKFSKIK